MEILSFLQVHYLPKVSNMAHILYYGSYHIKAGNEYEKKTLHYNILLLSVTGVTQCP